MIDRQTFDAIIELAGKHGIYVFSDEVYRLLERSGSIRLPQVADVYERGLSLNVMSKAYGLPGLRIGWIATRDREILSAMERAKHYLSICNSGPSEVLALIALTGCESPEEKVAGFLESARELYAAEDLIKAELEVKNALQIQPKNAEANYLLAEISESRQDFQQMATEG